MFLTYKTSEVSNINSESVDYILEEGPIISALADEHAETPNARM